MDLLHALPGRSSLPNQPSSAEAGQPTGERAHCRPRLAPPPSQPHTHISLHLPPPPPPQPHAHTTAPLTTTAHTHAPQVDQWLDISQTLVPGAGFEGVCASANDFLSLRSFLVGHAPTLADVACWAQLQLTLQWDRLKKGGSLAHLARWWVPACRVPGTWLPRAQNFKI